MKSLDYIKWRSRAVWRDRACVFLLGVMAGMGFILIVTLLSSCAAIARWNAIEGQDEFVRQLTYRKDPRTGLCFAVREGGAGGMTLVDGKFCERKKR